MESFTSRKTKFWLVIGLFAFGEEKYSLKERSSERFGCKEEAYRFVSSQDKEFIAFDAEMNRLGYTRNRTIGDGIALGRKMIIYNEGRGQESKKALQEFIMRENNHSSYNGFSKQ